MPVFRLSDDFQFPNPALAEVGGLLAVGGDLSPQRLESAYSSGIFPWYSEGDPILWFSPDPRMILYPEKHLVSKSLSRTLALGEFQSSIDTAFDKVIEHCSKIPRKHQHGTWITQDMISAYKRMHKLGLAHSFETFKNGELVGGLYGISLGRAFFGESMFHQARDASKVAFHSLVEFCKKEGFLFIDAQQPTEHLKSLGAEKISRSRFMNMLGQALQFETLKGKWP